MEYAEEVYDAAVDFVGRSDSFHYDSPGNQCNEISIGRIPRGQITVRHSELSFAGDDDKVTINLGDALYTIVKDGQGYTPNMELPGNLLKIIQGAKPNRKATQELETMLMDAPDSIFQVLPYGL